MKRKTAFLLVSMLLISIVLPLNAFAAPPITPTASAGDIYVGENCTIVLGPSGSIYDASYKNAIKDIKLNGTSIPGGQDNLWWKHSSANSIIIDSYCMQVAGTYNLTLVATNYNEQTVKVKVLELQAPPELLTDWIPIIGNGFRFAPTGASSSDYLGKINGVSVNGEDVTAGDWYIKDGTIALKAAVLKDPGNYTITVTATGYKKASRTITMYPDSALAPVTGLKVSFEDGKPRLTWNDKSSIESGYRVTRSEIGGSDAAQKNLALVPANTTSFHDISAVGGTEYRYIVYIYITTETGRDLGPGISDVVTVTVPLEGQVAPPSASPWGGSYDEGQTVTLSCATDGAAIYYTTDGTTPTTASTKYTAPLNISGSYESLKAFATKAGMVDSTVMTEVYVIGTADRVSTPIASPAGKIYKDAQAVTLSCATDGATIRYTTDGTTPTTASPKYSTPLAINSNTSLKAIAVKSGIPSSDVMLEVYIINPNPEGSLENFLIRNIYKPGQFTDLDENSWFGYYKQKVIANAYDYGLMKGNSATTFNPSGVFTIAEAITVAARVHSLYMTGGEDFVQGSPWYQVYVDYGVNNGIIKFGDFTNYNAAATRAQMAYIFSHALPQTQLSVQNTVNSLPDVSNTTPYNDSIILLYKAGILTGSDDAGTFKPNNNITRAEVAAIISRLILPDTRADGKSYS